MTLPPDLPTPNESALQRLRDEAESRCIVAANNGDRDSADAWERIGLAIDECVKVTKNDFRVIEARTGLFGLRTAS